MAGTRGPIGKRSEERRRRNLPDKPVDRVAIGGDVDDLFGPDLPDERVETRLEAELPAKPVAMPEADEHWHPIAKMVYESLPESGQSMFFEPSDWAAAYLVCESISRDLEEQVVGTTETGQVIKDFIPMKGASLAAYTKILGELGMTEGARRRLSIELTRAKPEKETGGLPAGVTDINDARRGLLG
jgi:hypothetical protein